MNNEKKHGGPDLGPTRARKQWEDLGVDGRGIADLPPGEDFSIDDLPRLTLRMTARLQAFPHKSDDNSYESNLLYPIILSPLARLRLFVLS